MVSEITVGRFTESNSQDAYKKLGGTKWGLVGVVGIVCGIMFLSVYNVVAGWSFGYFLDMVFGSLIVREDLGGHFGAYVADATDNFFYSLGFMALTAIIVGGGVKRGIETAAKVLMPFLFLLLIGMILYSITLPNAMDGVKYYLIPDLSSITFPVVYSALGQAFFSLSLGMGAMIVFGSYLGKGENISKSAMLVVIADTSVAVLAGLLIFPLVFSQGQSPTAGPGLVFVALPGIFQAMGPVTGKIVGGSFFLLLCFAALTSTIALLEVPTAWIVEKWNLRRKPVVFISAAVIFIIGIPSMLSHGAVEGLTNFVNYEGTSKKFFDVIFDVFGEIGLFFGAFMLTVFISRKWNLKDFSGEIAIGNPSYPGSLLEKVLNILIKWICPAVLGTMFVITLLQKFFGVQVIG